MFRGGSEYDILHVCPHLLFQLIFDLMNGVDGFVWNFAVIFHI